MAHGNEHGHEHGHGNDRLKALVLSAALIAAFLGGVRYLAQQGLVAHAQANYERVKPPTYLTPGEQTAFAKRFEAGQRKKGSELAARAAGARGEIFEISWKTRPSRREIDRIVTSEKIAQSAQAVGFAEFRVVAGGEILLKKALAPVPAK
ncbi:MAG: hypothetical protein H6707_17015 [Deltaproteobacteria bacterium]|nr:hypothetical protein [Deltaproteobacteria bacterium]